MPDARVAVEAVEPRLLFAGTNLRLVISPVPASVPAGYAFTDMTVSLEDATGVVFTTGFPVAVSLQLTGTNTSATETEDTFGGVARFHTAFNATGARPATFVATALHYDTAASAPIAVTPGAASHFGLAPNATDPVTGRVYQQADPVAGVPYGGAEILAVDQFGNLTTTSDGDVLTVALTGPDKMAVTAPTATVVDDQASIAQGVLFTKMGVYDAQIADTTAAGTISSTVQLYVHGGSAARLLPATIQPDLNTMPGVPLDGFTVLVTDAYGNPASGNPPVSLAVSPAGASITGPLTVPAQQGAAIFNGVSFPAPGTYTLTITCGDLPPAKLGPIRVANRSTTSDTVAGHPLAPVTFNLADSPDGPVPRRVLMEVLGPEQNVVQRRVLPVVHGKVVVKGVAPRQAGDYTLVLSDGAGDDQFQAQSFTVLPGPAVRATFASAPAIANGQLSAVVQVVDKFGNLTRQADGDTAAMAPARGPAGRGLSLPGARTAVVAGGMATFSDVPVTTSVARLRPRLTVTVGRLAVTSSPLASPASTT